MPFLPIILLEIFSAGIILSISSLSNYSGKNLFHMFTKKVIAQEATNDDASLHSSEPSFSEQSNPPPSAEQTSSESNTTSSDSSGSVEPTTVDTTSSSNNDLPKDSGIQTQSSEPSLLDQITNSSNSQTNLTESPVSQESAELTPTPLPTSQSEQPTPSSNNEPIQEPTPAFDTSQNSASVLNPDDIVSSPEHINPEIISSTQNEEEKLSKAQTPLEESKLLIEFAGNAIKNIDKTVKNDDFSSTSFIVSRLNDQIDDLTDNIQTLPSQQGTQIKKQLNTFCKQADLLLKNQQLSVPEDEEQDIEIIRGKCLDKLQ